MSGRGHPFCVFPGFFSSLFLSLSLSLSLFGWNGSVVHDIRASEHEMIGDDGRALHFLSAIAARWRSLIGSSFFFLFFSFFFLFFRIFPPSPACAGNERNESTTKGIEIERGRIAIGRPIAISASFCASSRRRRLVSARRRRRRPSTAPLLTHFCFISLLEKKKKEMLTRNRPDFLATGLPGLAERIRFRPDSFFFCFLAISFLNRFDPVSPIWFRKSLIPFFFSFLISVLSE